MSAPKVDKARSRQAEAYADAVSLERKSMFPTSTPEERESARTFRPCVYPMPACISCGRFRFPVPTVCFWCRPTPNQLPTAPELVVSGSGADSELLRAQLAGKKPRKRSPRRP